MIKVEKIKKIVKLCLVSTKIKNMKPLSLLVVAKAGSGKTELIMSYEDKSLDFITDLNYSSLIEKLKDNKGIKSIIIPDFIKITHKKSSTSKNLISLLNSATEEGLFNVEGYYKHNFKGRQLGLITSITNGTLGQVKQEWGNIGFLDRMIICSYSYSKKTIKEILKSICEEGEKKVKREKLNIPIKNKKSGIEVTSEYKFNFQLIDFAKDNPRALKNMKRLLRCNALINGRTKVNQNDVDEIKDLSKFLNLKRTEL